MMLLNDVDFFSQETIEKLFTIFEKDFIKNDTYLSDGRIKYLIDVKEKNFCICPFGNLNKPERFWHIITKKVNENQRTNNPCRGIESNRIYDPARAKRIHWIKPIITNWLSDDDIVHFYEKIKGKETLHLWHQKKDFIVIIRKESNNSNRFLVSTYLVYKDQRHRYKKRLRKYNENKPIGIEWF